MGQTREEKIILEFESRYGSAGIKQLQSDLFIIKKQLAESQGKIVEFGKKVVLSQKLQQQKVSMAQQRIATSMSDAINQSKQFKDVNQMITEGIGQYNNRLAAQKAKIAATNKVTAKSKTLIDKLKESHNKLTGAMLGVMFFGMAIRSMFSSLFGPVMEAYGVMELFSAVLLVTMLPVMEMIFPVLLKIAEIFLNLPQPVQLVIGVIAALAVVFGSVLMVVGMIALGILGIVQVLSFFGISLGAVSALFGTLFLPFLAILAVAIAAWLVFKSAFEENFLGIQTFVQMIWDGIANIFKGVFDVIAGIWSILVGIFTGDFTKIKEGFVKLFTGIWEIIKGFVELVIGLFATIGITILKFITGLWDIGYSMGEALAEGIVSAYTWIKDAFWGWLPSFSELKKKVLSIFGMGGGSDSGVSSKSSGSSPKKFNDMIWRPGSAPVSISPQDTLVATKGGPAGGGSSITYAPVTTIQVMDKYELERILNARDSKLLDDLRRLTRGA